MLMLFEQSTIRTNLQKVFCWNFSTIIRPLIWMRHIRQQAADQMTQFATAVGLEESLASFGMLEDLFLKSNFIGRGGLEERRPVG